VILLLVGIVGWMYQEDRKGLSSRMQEGFAEVKVMFMTQSAKYDKLDERQDKLDSECLKWEDLRRLGYDEKIRDHDRDIAAMKATCRAKHD
jgi:hypothetical protein